MSIHPWTRHEAVTAIHRTGNRFRPLKIKVRKEGDGLEEIHEDLEGPRNISLVRAVRKQVFPVIQNSHDAKRSASDDR